MPQPWHCPMDFGISGPLLRLSGLLDTHTAHTQRDRSISISKNMRVGDMSHLSYHLLGVGHLSQLPKTILQKIGEYGALCPKKKLNLRSKLQSVEIS